MGATKEAITVTHDSGVASSTVTVTIIKPDHSVSVDAASMTENPNKAGEYYYSFAPDASGVWRALIVEGSLRYSKEYHVDMGQEEAMKGSGFGATDTLKALDDDLTNIEADTGELQTDWHDGGRLDLIIDAVATAAALATVDSIVDSILADTNELQTDWANGGRLDAILDLVALEATLTAIKGTGWASDDNLKNLDDEIDVIDGLLDVPSADAATNALMREGVGNKGDSEQWTVGATSSLMRYTKAFAKALWGGTGFTASASTVNTITAAALADVADKYEGQIVMPLAGNMAFDPRIIKTFDGTQTLTVHRDWPQAPGNVAFIVMSNPLGDLLYGSKGLEAIYDLVDAIMDLAETGGTFTTDGSEQQMYVNNAPSGVFEPRTLKVDLTAMLAGDSMRIRVRERVKSGGSLIVCYDETFSGAQGIPLVKIPLDPNRYGVETTIQRTAGVDRSIDWEVLYSG
jgi:hypothetical protein